MRLNREVARTRASHVEPQGHSMQSHIQPSHLRKGSLQIAALVVLALCIAATGAARTQKTTETSIRPPVGRWCGVAQTDARRWDLCLDTTSRNSSVDVPSLWIARQPVALSGNASEFSFPFPWNYGSVSGHFTAAGFVGKVHWAKGATSPVILRRSEASHVTHRPFHVPSGGFEI